MAYDEGVKGLGFFFAAGALLLCFGWMLPGSPNKGPAPLKIDPFLVGTWKPVDLRIAGYAEFRDNGELEIISREVHLNAGYWSAEDHKLTIATADDTSPNLIYQSTRYVVTTGQLHLDEGIIQGDATVYVKLQQRALK